MSISKMRLCLSCSAIATSLVMAAAVLMKSEMSDPPKQTAQESQNSVVNVSDKTYDIIPMPERFTSYLEIQDTMKSWSSAAPEIAEYASYGKTSLGTCVSYLRLGTKDKPKILVHSGIAADEEYSIIQNMKLAERILKKYGKETEATWLIKNRDIYFVPVVSPDTFIRTAIVEGKNPESSFPCRSKLNPDMPSTVKLLIDFVQNNKFSASLNFHTYGEHFSLPSNAHEKDAIAMSRVAQKMADLSGYKIQKVSGGGNPTDLDWLYSNGCFSIDVMWGAKDRKFVAYSEIDSAMDRMYDSLALFMREGPESSISPVPLPSVHFYQTD